MIPAIAACAIIRLSMDRQRPEGRKHANAWRRTAHFALFAIMALALTFAFGRPAVRAATQPIECSVSCAPGTTCDTNTGQCVPKNQSTTQNQSGTGASGSAANSNGTSANNKPAADPSTDKTTTLDRILLLFGGIFFTLALWIGKVIDVLISVMVTVIVYNHFTTSQVVSSGWAIVRDAINMFYVILLIAIAFGTIIGYHKFNWRQQVPNILKWAIIINFSKTLCGLAIDASQVFTLTFANAIKDIAGGNFISAFGLTSVVGFAASSASKTDVKSVPDIAGYFGAGVGATVMFLIVLGALVALLVILVFRIVMLWVLIVIAPLAWFVGSAKGIIESNAYSQWWDNFKCFLVIGPVLTFFLWLALSVAGAGNIAATEGFNAPPVDSGILNQIFEPGRLTSFIIALAILWAGFQTANNFCQAAAGGIVQKALGKAQSFAKGTAMAPLNFLGVGAGAKNFGGGLGSRIPLVGSRGLLVNRGTLLRGAQGAAQYIPGVLGGTAISGGLGKMAEQAETTKRESEGVLAKRAESAAKAFVSDEQKMRFMREAADYSKGGKKSTRFTGNEEAILGNLKKAVDDKDYRKKMEDAGVNVGDLLQAYDQDMVKKFGGDEKWKASFKDFKEENPHVFLKDDKGNFDVSSLAKDPDKMKKVNFDAINKAGATEFMDQLAARMKQEESGEVDKDGKPLNMYEAARLGKFGGKAALAMNNLAAKQPITSLVRDDGSFASDLDEKDFVEKIRRNPEVIASVSTQLGANGGNNDAASALAASVTEKNLQAMVRKSRDPQTDDVTKRNLQSSMESLLGVLQTASRDTLNDEKEQKKYDRLVAYVTTTGLNRPLTPAPAVAETAPAAEAEAAPAAPAAPAPSGIDTAAVQNTFSRLRARIQQIQSVNTPANPMAGKNQAEIDDLNRQVSELDNLLQEQARAQRTLERAEDAAAQGTGDAQAVQAVRDRIAGLEAEIRRRTPSAPA